MLMAPNHGLDASPVSCHRFREINTSILSFMKMLLHPRAHTISEKNIDEVEEQLVLNSCVSSHCIFCGASEENGFNVIWQNDRYTVFTDINPSCEQHLQIVPKKHIESVKTLKPCDAAIVREMMEIGHDILDSMDVPPKLRRLGFHVPPYISVPHLHMHVQVLPYRSLLRRLKYPIAPGRKGYEKGFSWFAEAEQTARLLEKGSQVRILPC